VITTISAVTTRPTRPQMNRLVPVIDLPSITAIVAPADGHRGGAAKPMIDSTPVTIRPL
jgi:hypothetical protein